MRVLLGWALALSLVASPAMARNNGSDDSAGPAGTDSTTPVAAPATAKPAASAGTTAAKPAAASTESEIEELRDLMESQARQLQEQSEQLKLEQQKMEALEQQLKLSSAREAVTPASPATLTASVPASSSIPVGAASGSAAGSTSAAVPASPAPIPQGIPDSPVQFHLGSAFITPLGFMDFTGVGRTTNAGNGIGSNFGSIPYQFLTSGGVLNPLVQNTEARFSMQNSRFGIRVDAMVKGAHVIGYTEWDFLGNNASSVAVTSNSNTFRSRLYWVDLTKGKWEVLAGQSWSLITPGRTGISPLPGNIFYSQDMDVNYQLGLTWARLPEVRFVFHPSTKVALAFALDQNEQYVGGSGGGGIITAPSGSTGVNGGVNGSATGTTALIGTQLDNAGTTVSAPELFPDIVVKAAFDPSSKVHFEIGGLETQFKVAVNSGTGAGAGTTPLMINGLTGGGAFVNANVQLFKGFRLIENYYYSLGGGRYIFGLVPDVIVNPNGTLSQIVAQSTVDGFEWTIKNTLIYGYYGGVWAGRNIGVVNGLDYGYGVHASGATSSSSLYTAALTQNRTMGEPTIGFNQTVWRDPKFGALNVIGQYSYIWRDPWSVPVGQPAHATLNLFFIDLRYTLPGAAPAAAELR